MEKKEIRQQIRKKLLKLNNLEYDTQSAKIREKLLHEPSILEGKTIAITISVKPEVDTIHLIEKLWQLGKHVVVPKCNAKTREMIFYRIENFTQLENVYMDLREPIPQLCEIVPKSQIDVCIVPGIVFDKFGYRIGYGGGYYDRFLLDYKGKTIAIAFHEQLIGEVPRYPHDLPVGLIITDHTRVEISTEG